jgi:hypothetical protein
MRTWRSFGALLSGDVATAESLLPESYEVLLGLDEHFMMSWNLWVQAMIPPSRVAPRRPSTCTRAKWPDVETSDICGERW